MNNIEYSIGRELIMLSHTIEHINFMEKYYASITERDGDLNHMEVKEDHSERYMSVQHLANFKQLQIDDLENHYIGFGMRIVKRERILEILGDKANFIDTIKQVAKDKIFQYLSEPDVKFSGKAIHYFLGSRLYAQFELEIPEYSKKIAIKDAFIGYELDQKEESLSKKYVHMIGLEL